MYANHEATAPPTKRSCKSIWRHSLHSPQIPHAQSRTIETRFWRGIKIRGFNQIKTFLRQITQQNKPYYFSENKFLYKTSRTATFCAANYLYCVLVNYFIYVLRFQRVCSRAFKIPDNNTQMRGGIELFHPPPSHPAASSPEEGGWKCTLPPTSHNL